MTPEAYIDTALASVAEADEALMERMAVALMDEFPGEEGYDQVLGQLPHLYMAMLQAKAE
ncbi:hypothetical protein D3C85_903080 [compost metagenome]